MPAPRLIVEPRLLYDRPAYVDLVFSKSSTTARASLIFPTLVSSMTNVSVNTFLITAKVRHCFSSPSSRFSLSRSGFFIIAVASARKGLCKSPSKLLGPLTRRLQTAVSCAHADA
jgi:hypothetical protein